MKVIFLDFDGVLNNIDFLIHRDRKESQIELDPQKMHLLREIVTWTDAKIVLTSSWRFRPGLEDFFEEFHMRIYDKVEELGDRSKEIDKWLSENEVENYLILDDESSFYTEEQMEHAIITCECYDQKVRLEKPYFDGLQSKHVQWAEKMLEDSDC